MKRITITGIILFQCFILIAQDDYFETWKKEVQWDGVTHWSRYMQTVPGFMGPNALPIPFTGEGTIDSMSSFSFSMQKHVMKGDNTTNLTLYFNHVIVKDVISIDAFMVPVEWFDMSEEIKVERRVPAHYYNAKTAMGDLHGNINFQVLNRLRSKVHLVARAGMRFPTSNKLGAARFTDMPGYFFDVSGGKPLNENWKLFGNAGFYVWETIDRKLNRQDDAFLFGAGVSYHNNKEMHCQLALSGYLGYMESTRDKPIVARMTVSKKWERIKGFIRLQQGINHFKYSSAEFGIGYLFWWDSFSSGRSY